VESSFQPETNNKTELKSAYNEYQTIRNFLIERRLLKSSDTPSNTNHLWNYKNASYLWFEARCFIEDVLKNNESQYKESIISEWRTAISGSG
jgi:hypothetical protein